MGTGEVDLLLELVYRHADIVDRNQKVADIVRLEADRADKARRLVAFGGRSPKGVDGHAVDGDTTELAAQGKSLFRRYKALMLDSVFRLEFGRFAFELFKPIVSGGEIGFERCDPVTAEERAATLGKLAQFLDEFDETGDCGDFHGGDYSITERLPQ